MLSNMMFYLILTMFILGNMIFISKYKHLLIMLMSLEFMVLSLFMFLSLLISLAYFNMSLLMIYLVFSVCEGALGLSILISMIRTHGNDYFNSFNILF